MDLSLTREQELLRASRRELRVREIAPHAREWDRSETMDREIVAKLADVGFLGAVLPEKHGGMALDTISYCLVMEELGRVDSSVRGIVSVNLGLVGKKIVRWGTEAQKQEWLPRLVSGEALGCYALTEPEAGSDPRVAADEGRARRRRLGALRVEDLHHARVVGGARARLRPQRWRGRARDHLLPRPHEGPRLRGTADRRQARPACAGYGG